MNGLVGTAQLTSTLFSPVWTLSRQGEVLCTGRRSDLRHPHTVRFSDGRTWTIERRSFDLVQVVENNTVLASATRLDVRGAWEISSQTFAFELRPRSFLRHRWDLIVGGQPIATLRGGLLTFNRMAVDATLPVPLEGLWLAWTVAVHTWRAVGGPDDQ